MGNFKIGNKVKFIGSRKDDGGFQDLKTGKVYNVQENSFKDAVPVIIDEVGDEVSLDDYRCDAFELVESKPSKKQRIETLEKEVSELKLIVHELRERKPSVFATLEGQDLEAEYAEQVKDLPSTDISVEDKQADVIEFEGQQYRKVERLAVEGDVVIFTSIPEDESGVDVEEGKPYRAYEGKGLYKKYIKDDTGFTLHIYGGGILRGTTETVDVYEPINQPVQRQTVPCSAVRPPIEEVGEAFFEGANKVLNPKTANELRGEVIEKAKRFIEESKTTVSGFVAKGFPGEGINMTLHDVYSVIFNCRKTASKAEFSVDEENRIVTVFLKGIVTGNLHKQAIAEFTPNDVFNEHIGKAIALGRALGLDVSEFEQAVQPSEYVVGQIVDVTFIGGGKSYLVGEVTKVANQSNLYFEKNAYDDYCGEGTFYPKQQTHVPQGSKIINDTNAIYGGVE